MMLGDALASFSHAGGCPVQEHRDGRRQCRQPPALQRLDGSSDY